MSNFLFKLPLLAKHLSKYYLKNKNGENFVETFEDIDFSYSLLPSINFPLVNIIEYWKLIQIVEAVTFAIALRWLLLFLDMF